MSNPTADPIVIVRAARTMGAFQCNFASHSASDLGDAAIKAAIGPEGAG